MVDEEDIITAFDPNQMSIVRSLSLCAMLVFALNLASCSKGKVDITACGITLDTAYSMRTYNAHTLVSDSGLIQYKLQAKDWIIYSSGTNPRWYFPEGIYLEQFDESFKTKATVKADTARYFTNDDMWELIGHVHIRNVSGEQFYAPRMYWDRRVGRVFSPDSVYILTLDQELRGHSFDAAQDMSRYTFISTSGSMEYQEESNPQQSSSSEIPSEPRKTKRHLPADSTREANPTPAIFSTSALSTPQHR